MSVNVRSWGMLAVAFGVAGCGVDEYNEQMKKRRDQWRTEFRREQSLGKTILDQKRQFSFRPPAGLLQKPRGRTLLMKYEGTVGDERVPRFLFVYVSNNKAIKGRAFSGQAETALAKGVGHRVWPRPKQEKIKEIKLNGKPMRHYQCPVKMRVTVTTLTKVKSTTPGAGAMAPPPPGAGPAPGPDGQFQPPTKVVKSTRQATKAMRFWVYVHEGEAAGPPPKVAPGKPAPPRAWRILFAYGCHDVQSVKDDFAEAQRFSIESLQVGPSAMGARAKGGDGPAGKGGGAF